MFGTSLSVGWWWLGGYTLTKTKIKMLSHFTKSSRSEKGGRPQDLSYARSFQALLSRKEAAKIIKVKTKHGGTSTEEGRPGVSSGEEVG